MRFRPGVVTAFMAVCAIAVGAALLSLDRPPPAEAALGDEVGDFQISAAADPPAGFSVAPRMHMAGGVLYVEKLEFFFNPGTVPRPTITKPEDGTALIHIWVTRPRVQLMSTKCEFVRTVRFSIPATALRDAKRLVLVNHDTQERQVLAEQEVLTRFLHEPKVVSIQAGWRSPLLSPSGGGC